jgi:hypothetical protein
MIPSTPRNLFASPKVTRRILGIGACLAALTSARAQETAARIVFNPALNVPLAFRVRYGIRDAPTVLASPGQEWLNVTYRLTVTAIAREREGHRLRLGTSEIGRPGPLGGMDMVVAAALILDGFDVEMLVDARGFMKEIVDWPNVRRALARRADTMADGFGHIGHSVVDDRTADQATWPLFPAIEAMNSARSYLDLAERTGASTISWYGSPIDVTVEPANADGAVAMTWLSPAGAKAQPSSEGRATIRRDGFPAKLSQIVNDNGPRGPAQHVTEIEAMALR